MDDDLKEERISSFMLTVRNFFSLLWRSVVSLFFVFWSFLMDCARDSRPALVKSTASFIHYGLVAAVAYFVISAYGANQQIQSENFFLNISKIFDPSFISSTYHEGNLIFYIALMSFLVFTMLSVMQIIKYFMMRMIENLRLAFFRIFNTFSIYKKIFDSVIRRYSGLRKSVVLDQISAFASDEYLSYVLSSTAKAIFLIITVLSPFVIIKYIDYNDGNVFLIVRFLHYDVLRVSLIVIFLLLARCLVVLYRVKFGFFGYNPVEGGQIISFFAKQNKSNNHNGRSGGGWKQALRSPNESSDGGVFHPKSAKLHKV